MGIQTEQIPTQCTVVKVINRWTKKAWVTKLMLSYSD